MTQSTLKRLQADLDDTMPWDKIPTPIAPTTYYKGKDDKPPSSLAAKVKIVSHNKENIDPKITPKDNPPISDPQAPTKKWTRTIFITPVANLQLIIPPEQQKASMSKKAILKTLFPEPDSPPTKTPKVSTPKKEPAKWKTTKAKVY